MVITANPATVEQEIERPLRRPCLDDIAVLDDADGIDGVSMYLVRSIALSPRADKMTII